MEYKIFDPKIDGPLHELPNTEAKKAYDWFLSNIPFRIEQLLALAGEDGIELDFSEVSLIKLHHWFYEIVDEERQLGNDAPSPELFSLCNDIGIYLAEMLKKESKDIKWEFYDKDSKGLSYQRPVIVGFNVRNEDYYVDFDYLLCQYSFRILKNGKKENDLFLSMFKRAQEII